MEMVGAAADDDEDDIDATGGSSEGVSRI